MPLRPAFSQVADSNRERGLTVHGETAGTNHSARKSPSRAVLYSAGGTTLLTPILVGPIVGPSFGHFYADANGHAWRGIALRSGGVLLAGTLLPIDFASLSHARTWWEDYTGIRPWSPFSSTRRATSSRPGTRRGITTAPTTCALA